MPKVTIEGTLTPSTYLARGARTTVELTDAVRRKVKRGYIKIVKVHEPELTDTEREADLQAELARNEIKLATERSQTTLLPPLRNASRDDWAEFLAQYTDHAFVTEGKNRDALITEWDRYVNPPAEDHDTIEPTPNPED